MRPLIETDRRRLFGFSAVLCAAPLVLAPLAARSSFGITSGHRAFEASLELRMPVPVKPRSFSVTRDPFVADAGTDPASVPTASEAGAPVVRALVTGSVPYALLDAGGLLRIVRSGDGVAGSTVRSIDAGGVHLQDGRVISLADRRL